MNADESRWEPVSLQTWYHFFLLLFWSSVILTIVLTFLGQPWLLLVCGTLALVALVGLVGVIVRLDANGVYYVQCDGRKFHLYLSEKAYQNLLELQRLTGKSSLDETIRSALKYWLAVKAGRLPDEFGILSQKGGEV